MVTIHEVVDQQPYPWLVMELIVGRSLREVLNDGPITPARAARVGLDVLGALHAAHDAGVMHRDVKPSNVLIRSDGIAMLTDFGIATVAGSQTLTAAGDVTGSPEYMAPERIRGREVGTASDLWSLGMLLYICVEGANPMQRDSVWQTMLAICEQPVPPPSHAGALAPAIEALLLPLPDHRPSAAGLAVMLAAVAESENPSATIAVTVLSSEPATVVADKPTLVDRSAATTPADVPAAQVTATQHRRWRSRRALLIVALIASAAIASAAAFILMRPGDSSDNDAAGVPPVPATDRSGKWIAQLSEIPQTTDTDVRDTEVASLQQQVPGATLLDSTDWGALPPGQWIVRAPGDFASGYDVLDFCAKHNLDQCSGRYLSSDSADRDYFCRADDPAPDPAACRRPGDPSASSANRSS